MVAIFYVPVYNRASFTIVYYMTYALNIQNLTKYYGDYKAVDNLSLTIPPGEFFGFLGPNGAGKTTTISSIVGTNIFQDGSIRVFGYDVVKDYRMARMQVGLSPQDFNVDPFLTVKDILWYMGGFYSVLPKERKRRIAHLLDLLNLNEHANKLFGRLSGGLKRRVMLARAMIHDPMLLILDEPTAALDIEIRYELWEYLKQLNQMGKTILLTSHYLEEIELLCNNIAVIHRGKLVFSGPKDVFKRDGHSLEQTFMELIRQNNEH